MQTARYSAPSGPRVLYRTYSPRAVITVCPAYTLVLSVLFPPSTFHALLTVLNRFMLMLQHVFILDSPSRKYLDRPAAKA